jgi:hypothetical protein
MRLGLDASAASKPSRATIGHEQHRIVEEEAVEKWVNRDPWVLDLLQVGDARVVDVLARDGRLDRNTLVGQGAVIREMCE